MRGKEFGVGEIDIEEIDMDLKYLESELEKVEYLSNILKSRARGNEVSNKEYKKLREELLKNEILKDLLPRFIKTNSDIQTFWSYIKTKFKTYDERTNFIDKEFKKVIEYLKKEKEGNMSINVEKKYINKENLKQVLKEYFTKNNSIVNIYGEFKLTKKNIGNGGTSIVTEFELHSKKYAIKFLLENIANKESKAYKRFKQAHLNLLSIQYTGVILPQMHMDKLKINENIVIPYIIMPIANKTLKKLIEEKKKEEKFDIQLFEKVFNSLIDAIDIIHNNKIIHRDIKPENIFILNRKLVLGDFDIAKFDKEKYIKLVETQKTDRLGNFYFSAPEQVHKDIEEISFEADWYSFGQILYWMIMDKSLRGQDKIILPNEYKKYEKLIEKLLQENPKKRLKSKNKILNFLKEQEKLSVEDILFEFEDIIFKYTPEYGQSGEGFKRYSDVKDINEIMQDLSNQYKKLELWWSQGVPDNQIRNIKKLNLCDRCWLLDDFEIKIKSIWFFKHYYNLGCSLIIIETDKLESTKVYNKVYVHEEVILFKDRYIDRKFGDTGWAIIDGKRIKLEEYEIRIRVTDNDMFFIAPQSGPIIRYDSLMRNIHYKYKETKIINEKILEPLKQIKKPEWNILK